MADKYAADFNQKPLYMAEAGNAWGEDYTIAVAANQNDKLYLGIIPAGVRVDQVRFIWEDGGAGNTMDVGYEPVDSTPSAVGDYWIDGQDIATAAGNAFSSALPITFEKPVKLVATVLGANLTNTPRFTVIVKGTCVGIK